jgi:cytochrome c oxidase subunit 1
MTTRNIYVPSVAFDAPLMKNLIFFGHVFINATIYMAVIGVYECRATPAAGKSAGRFASWAAVTLIRWCTRTTC